MKKLLALILLLALSSYAQAGMVVGSGAAGAPAALFEDGFEGAGAADAANLAGYNSWGTGGQTTAVFDDGDIVAPQSGTYYIIVNGSDSYVYPHTFTTQSSGTFTVRLYYYPSTETGTDDIFDVGTTWTWDTSFATIIGRSGGLLTWYTGGSFTNGAINFPDATWVKIEVEFNVDAHTFKVWVNGTAENSGNAIAFQNNVSPTTISIHDKGYFGVDNIKIYTGARDGS